MFPYRLTEIVSYLIAIFLSILLGFVASIYFTSKVNRGNKLVLETIHNSIYVLLAHDINMLSSVTETVSKPLIFKNLYSIDKDPNSGESKNEDYIKVKNYALHITNSKKETIIDLQEVKELISELVPPHIYYKIAINMQTIAGAKSMDKNIELERTYKIASGAFLSIGLGINQASEYYILQHEEARYKAIYSSISFLILEITLIYLLIRYIRENNLEKELREGKLLEQMGINEKLMLHKETEEQLRTMFIKKATSMYLEEPISVQNNAGITRSKDIVDYLFPIILKDNTPEKVEILTLLNQIANYFAYEFKHITIKTEYIIEEVNVYCSKEVLYQITLSLVHNVIKMMLEQSDIPKTLFIKATAEKVFVVFDGFPINNKNILNVFESIDKDEIDFFILPFDILLHSMSLHNFSCDISSQAGKNTISLTLPQKVGNALKPTVINFKRYKDAKNN